MPLNTKSGWLWLATILFLNLCLVNCVGTGILSGSATASSSAVASAYLLTIDYQGGRCQYGTCHEQTRIYRDGSFTHSDVPGVESKGELDSTTLNELKSLIETSNFATLRSVKFTGQCPTSYDGQETIYTFYRSGGAEVISDCQFVIDYHAPLFQKITELLPRIGTAVAHLITPTASPTVTPPALTSLETLLQTLATQWHCFSPKIEARQDGQNTIYGLICQIAAAENVTVYLELFATEGAAQETYKPVPGATPTSFHGLPAAEASLNKTRDESTEYLIIQAHRLLITIYSHFDEGFGMATLSAAENLYQALIDLKLDFPTGPLTDPTPSPVP